MTEEEAKKKWCPMREMGFDNVVKDFTCIASDCMMWRIIDTHIKIDKDTYCTSVRCLSGCNYGKGYCGLGGKP
jgi:hypothetical protein